MLSNLQSALGQIFISSELFTKNDTIYALELELEFEFIHAVTENNYVAKFSEIYFLKKFVIFLKSRDSRNEIQQNLQ